MRPARAFPRVPPSSSKEALKQAKSKAEFQRIQCLWLRASLGLNADQVAGSDWMTTHFGATAQAQYLKEGEPVLKAIVEVAAGIRA